MEQIPQELLGHFLRESESRSVRGYSWRISIFLQGFDLPRSYALSVRQYETRSENTPTVKSLTLIEYSKKAPFSLSSDLTRYESLII
jgi:hypothetical protein